MRETPVHLVLRGKAEHAVAPFTRSFYWSDRERLALGPLPSPAAEQLFDSCVERFGLPQFELAHFRHEVLELSKQIPSAIVKMCALASDPRYQYGSRIKIESVYKDYLKHLE